MKTKLLMSVFAATSMLSLQATDETPVSTAFDYKVTSYKPTEAWNQVVTEAETAIAQPESCSLDTTATLLKNIWDWTIPEDINFSGRINFGASDVEITNAQDLPAETFLTRLTFINNGSTESSAWSRLLETLAACDNECQSLAERQNPFDVIDTYLPTIREILDNSEITLKVDMYLSTK